MKFAINLYARFRNSQLDYKLVRDDIFVVPSEFEENPAFIEGLRIGAFQWVEITTIDQLRNAVGVEDWMIEEFVSNLETEEIVEEVAPPEDSVDEGVGEGTEAEPDVPPEDHVDEVKDEGAEGDQPATQDEGETPPDSVPDEEEAKDDAEVVDETTPEQEGEKEPVLAFTEETDGWQAAVALVNEETDVEKLTFALRKDERKSVKKACVARLKELGVKI